MGERTGIQWNGQPRNPARGCTEAVPGRAYNYAVEAMRLRSIASSLTVPSPMGDRPIDPREDNDNG